MDVQLKLIDLIRDGLTKSPQTAQDAAELHKMLTDQLALHIASNLPSIEAKAFLAAQWIEKEIEAGCSGKLAWCTF